MTLYKCIYYSDYDEMFNNDDDDDDDDDDDRVLTNLENLEISVNFILPNL